MRALGARSVTAAGLLAGMLVAMWRMERFRLDYWAQLSPWVTFLAGGFGIVAGTLVFAYWRLGERSHYYLRIGERMPFGEETPIVGPVIVGRDAYLAVTDLPPRVLHALYVAIFAGIALISLDNRAVALLHEVPSRFDRSAIDYCKPPEPPKPIAKHDQGCKLVERAYKLGYAKSLGSCAPEKAKTIEQVACTRRQFDEPYLHFAVRKLADKVDDLRTVDGGPGVTERLGAQLAHLSALVRTTIETVGMRPRSSHHVFTNLPDPRPAVGDRVARLLERGCGARLAHLPHFPRMEDGPAGPSKLFEHVLAQLMFNPVYKPIVAQCEEIVVHWAAAPDTCAKIAAQPRDALAALGVLADVREVLDWRARRAEIRPLDPKYGQEPPAAQHIVSFQCLMFDPTPQPVADHAITLDGEALTVREARTAPLAADGASQIRLYKQLAALLAPGFGYGRLTSNQAFGVAPEETTLADAFHQPGFLMTKLDLLRDADLFLGNDWLAKRPDLLEVYPYHVHLQTFIEIFRRAYKQHEGRL